MLVDVLSELYGICTSKQSKEQHQKLFLVDNIVLALLPTRVGITANRPLAPIGSLNLPLPG